MKTENMNAIEKYMCSHMSGIFKEPVGELSHPFIAPGAVYSSELWCWDAYWSSHAIFSVFSRHTKSELKEFSLTRERVERHIKGSIENFLDAQKSDGYIPTMISGGGLFEGYFDGEHERNVPLNQHMPFLCQWVEETCEFFGDHDVFDAEKLEAYLEYFEKNQFDKNSGLFFWQNDIMVGIDNNPTVYLRPKRSGADIFLNCFMYSEYRAFEKLLKKRGDGRADIIEKKVEELKTAINREMWDGRDGIYYSQDVGFDREKKYVKGVAFHSGLEPNYNSLPLKIRFWACFLPMYVGICDESQAEKMCSHLIDNDDILAEYGIRTLAKNEKMYSLDQSGNPSNWLGAVWTVANYCVYKGLIRYGKSELAEKIETRTEKLIGGCIQNHGDTFESYHPDTGEPFLNRGFLSFNLLALDMAGRTEK